MRHITRTQLNTRIFLFVFLLCSVVGIWHALPNVNVVGDESGYVGGVLRAMQLHTLQPHIDDAYTLSFLASYLLMIPVVTFVFVAAHLSTVGAITILFSNYYLLYLIPRMVSVLSALAIAYVFLRLSQKVGHSTRSTFVSVALVLSTIILTVIMHTGKMWTLSGLLLLLANYFCTKALLSPTEAVKRWYRSAIFWAIGCALLAVANFPLSLVSLTVVPVLWYMFKDSGARRSIMVYTCIWGVITAVLVLFNLHGWMAQDAATPTGSSPSFLVNIAYQLFLLVAVAPFLVLAIVSNIRVLKYRPLFFLALAELVLYIVLLAIRAPWAAGRLDMLRYDFFVVLLLGCMLVATALRTQKILSVLLVCSSLFYIQSLHLLAVPTTYNDARNWIITTFASQSVEIDNEIPLLDLPKNPASYALTKPELCESTCQLSQQYHFNNSYRYLVVDKESLPLALLGHENNITPLFVVTDVATTSSTYQLIRSFGQNPDFYFSLAYRTGLYDPRYLLIHQMGPVLYVYKVAVASK